MDLTDEQIIIQLQAVKQKSEEMYEKSVYLISSGTLLLSITFIEKIVKLATSIILWTLITSWVLLVITLLLNLISHQVSSHFHGKTVSDFQAKNENTIRNVQKRNLWIYGINIATSSCLIFGIGFLVLFCSINVNKMNRDTEPIRPQTIEPDQQKGMPINIPRGPIPSSPSLPPSQPSTNPTPPSTQPPTVPSR
jgi:hypothetical protein